MVYEFLKRKEKFKVYKIDYKCDILNTNLLKNNKILVI